MELRLCGAVQLCREEETSSAIALPSKSLGLLAFLLLEPGTHTRAELSSLLWGDSDEKKSSASLRQSLKQLRDTLGPLLSADGPTVALAAPVHSDVERFRALAREGAVEALAFDIPHLFAGLTIRDAPEFDEWMDRKRADLMREYRLAIAAAGRTAHKRRDWASAFELGTRWQTADPFSDDATHLVIEVLFLMGERDAALAAYRDYAQLRSREGMSAPGLGVRELASRIEHASLHPTPQRVRALAAVELPRFTAPLIGRAREWSTLQQAWERVQDGTGVVVLIDGEWGTGKSRLIDEFAQFAAVSGAVVLRARTFEARAELPYGPLLELLRQAITSAGAVGTDSASLSEIASILPDVRREFPAVPEPPARATSGSSMLPEAIAQLLLAIAEESPVVIALDDLQWSDSESCQVLHFLAQRLADAPICWCYSWTPGLSARDSAPSRLMRALRALQQHVRVDLDTLSGREVWQLIRAMGKVQDPDGAKRFAARVYEVTAGNPLYVIELIKTLFARGWIRVDRDTQEWIPGESGSGDLLVSELFPDAHAAIAERVAALPDEQHAVLLTVATAGGPCHTSLLSYVHGISRLRAAHLCDALVERRLVSEHDGHYTCAHAVIGQVVLDSMGTSRRREVHRMIALAYTDAAASIRREVDPGVVARHAAAGGESAMAFRYAIGASRACTDRQVWEDALGWLDLAAECAVTPDELREADAHTANVLSRSGWTRPPTRNGTPRSVLAIGRADVDLR